MTQPEQSVDRDRSSSPLQRRTLLQLALAASAGAALPGALSAATPTPTPTVTPTSVPGTEGHAAALKTILDRATNYKSGDTSATSTNFRYEKIWGHADHDARDDWFAKLANIGATNPLAISENLVPHPGTAVPNAAVPKKEYENTIQAARVVRNQIPVARERIQSLLLALEREAAWCAYQVGYRDGFKQAANDPTLEWTNVTIHTVTVDPAANVALICEIERKCHHLAENKLTAAPAELFDRTKVCPVQEVIGHESY